MKTSTYRVNRLSAEEREKLSEELFQVHEQVFTGVSYAEFRKYVIYSAAWRTWVFVRRTDSGEAVGYMAMHAFQQVLNGRRCIIYRLETGKLPVVRGRDLTLLRIVLRVFALGLRFPTRPSYLFCSLVYPAPYALSAKYAPTIWPHRSRPTPPAMLATMQLLAQQFGLPVVDPARPLIRKLNWMPREDQQRPPRWDGQLNPHALYFLDLNPDYAQGFGLLTLVPTDIPRMSILFVRFLAVRCARILKHYLLGPRMSTPATNCVQTSAVSTTKR